MKGNILYIILVVIVAFVAVEQRLFLLSDRPVHLDEAVQANITKTLLENESYEYDASEYHGPTLHYATVAFFKLAGKEKLSDLSLAELRYVPIIAGVLSVLAVLLMVDLLGKSGAVVSMVFLAVSPIMVYYSRYYIHEMLLVCLTVFLIGFAWRLCNAKTLRNKLIWAMLVGVFAGLSFATKETFIITIASMLFAVFMIRIMHAKQFRANSETNMKNGPGMIAVCGAVIAVFTLLTALLWFSSFGQNLQGISDSLLAFSKYFTRGFNSQADISAGAHDHGFWFYFSRLLDGDYSWRLRYGGLGVIALAIFAIARTFCKKISEDKNSNKKLLFNRWLAVYCIVITFGYCAIPYKTPWCALQFYMPIVLLAGLGAKELLVCVARLPGLPFLTVNLLVVCTLYLAHSSLEICHFKKNSDSKNPFAYSQTRRRYQKPG